MNTPQVYGEQLFLVDLQSIYIYYFMDKLLENTIVTNIKYNS